MIPTKEEIKAIVANQMKAGFVEVRPPMACSVAAQKKRIHYVNKIRPGHNHRYITYGKDLKS